MTRRTFAALAAAAGRGAGGEPFHVYRDHPRLFLTPARLRRLKRDRERRTERWERFETLISRGEGLPEPGFAYALHFQVAGDAASAGRAVRFAEDSPDVRQAAIVCDWCPNAERVEARLKAELAGGSAGTVDEARRRTLAAVATGNAPVLERTVREWWSGQIAPALNSGAEAVRRNELYALFELMHAVRDNTGIDLRDAARPFFEQFPFAELLSYYPPPYTAPQGDFRMPAVRGAAPDVRAAALSRAADLAAVAYDTNMQASQYLQGFLTYDRFQLRDAFGAPYEFLWANPYQPGLSYDLLPPSFYDSVRGRLFLRANWREDADWLGWFEGELQVYSGARLRVVQVAPAPRLFRIGDSAVIAVSAPGRFDISEPAKVVYIAGLAPRRNWRVEPARRKKRTAATDPGGVLRLDFEDAFSGELKVSAGS